MRGRFGGHLVRPPRSPASKSTSHGFPRNLTRSCFCPLAGSTMKSVVAINGVKASSYVGVRIQARVQPPRAARVAVVQCVAEDEAERLRLNNLSPQEGARRKKTRKGRGYGAGQGGTAGYGMRGQKSRSGSGIRPGFEGGQTPLYRKLPKLRGIAGGMGHGLPDYVRARSVFSSSSSSSLSLSSLSSSSLSLLLSCTPHGVTASRRHGLAALSRSHPSPGCLVCR